MTSRFSTLRDGLYERNPQSRGNVAKKAAQLRDEMDLADLRVHRSYTQVQMAEATGTTQSAISRLERQPDVLLSTLDEYVRATGGRLRLVADYGEYEVEIAVEEADRD